MRKFARYLLIAVVVSIVGGAMIFVWAMQRSIDVSTPEARAKQVEAMTLGCKLLLPVALQAAQVTTALSPAQTTAICGCATGRIIDTYAVDGRIKPSDVTETEIGEAQQACIKEMIAQ